VSDQSGFSNVGSGGVCKYACVGQGNVQSRQAVGADGGAGGHRGLSEHNLRQVSGATFPVIQISESGHPLKTHRLVTEKMSLWFWDNS